MYNLYYNFGVNCINRAPPNVGRLCLLARTLVGVLACWRFNVVVINIIGVFAVVVGALTVVGVVTMVKAESKNKTIFIWRRCRRCRCFKVIFEESFAHVCACVCLRCT